MVIGRRRAGGTITRKAGKGWTWIPSSDRLLLVARSGAEWAGFTFSDREVYGSVVQTRIQAIAVALLPWLRYAMDTVERSWMTSIIKAGRPSCMFWRPCAARTTASPAAVMQTASARLATSVRTADR